MQPMDRNLLFAALAAKTQFVDRESLEQSILNWDPDEQPLAQKLVADGKLETATVVAIEKVVDEHLRQRGGDTSQSLAIVQPDSEIARAFEQLQNWKVDAVRPQPGKQGTVVDSSPTAFPTTWSRFRRLAQETSDSEFGRYHVVGPLARGGIGEVFRARDLELNRDVALKRIQNRLTGDAFFRDRFLLEAEVTGALEHPNIVPVYGLNVDANGKPFYVMRLIRGQSLAQYIAEVYSLPRPLTAPRQTVKEQSRVTTEGQTDVDVRLADNEVSEIDRPEVAEGSTITQIGGAPNLSPSSSLVKGKQPKADTNAATPNDDESVKRGADQDAPNSDADSKRSQQAQAGGHLDLGEDFDGRLRRLLYRFVAVCQAVHYAHSRGILHRDLKPDNIMLGPYGETLVLDWGLAKVMDEKQTSKIAPEKDRARVTPDSMTEATPTMDGALIGTLAYMSPEQSLGWHDSLTPASDVYSLGATLYTILTGERSIRGIDIEDGLIKLQRGEFVEPITLNRRVPKAVNAICMKAMAVNASARYATAKEMADDLEAFLADEPTVAYQEPWLAKAGRWSRKHRAITTGFVVSAVLVSLSLGLGLILMSQARQKERLLKNQAISARNAANAYARSTFDVVEKIVDSVTNDPELATDQMRPLRDRLLDSVELTLAELTNTEKNAGVAINRASAFQQLGYVREQQGEFTEASAAYLSALALLDDLDPETRDSYEGRSLRVVSLINLAIAHGRNHRSQQRDEALEAADQLLRELHAEDPGDLDVQVNQANVANNRATYAMDEGDFKRAEAEFKRTIALREALLRESDDALEIANALLGTYGNLSIVYGIQGEFSKQSAELEKAIQLAEQYIVQQDEMPFLQSTYADLLSKQADLAYQIADRSDAIRYYQLALDVNRRIRERHPNLLQMVEQRAMIQSNLGGVFLSNEQFDEAAAQFNDAIRNLETVREISPDRTKTRDRLATTAMNLASLELNRGNLSEADELLLMSIQEHEALRDEFPSDRLYAAMLGTEYSLLADLRSKQDRIEDALAASVQSIEILEQLVATSTDSVENVARYASALHQQSVIQRKLGQLEEAKSSVLKARQLRKTLIEEGRAPINLQLDFHGSALLLVSILVEQSDYDEAIEVLIPTALQMESIVDEHPTNFDAPRFLFAIYSACLSVLSSTGDFEANMETIQARVDLTREKVPFEVRFGFAELLAAHDHVEVVLPLLEQWESKIEETPQDTLRSINLLSTCLSSLEKQSESNELFQELQPRAVSLVCRMIQSIKTQLNSPVDDILELFESDEAYTPLLENDAIMKYVEGLRGTLP